MVRRASVIRPTTRSGYYRGHREFGNTSSGSGGVAVGREFVRPIKPGKIPGYFVRCTPTNHFPTGVIHALMGENSNSGIVPGSKT